ncbi:hypothetical protein J5N97_016986 [Dioscorea zingiberensis]|uniref:Uncharacterized protein n=1 Tax=Dioscorea zingiberensis TaxID=325984 RepID=A0A9D5CKC8_9LILI|nr:hypothetical protein J5N97_016986 [Dioscorea zingiberensis]
MQSHPIGSTSNLSAVASEIMVTFILMFVTCGSVTDAMAAKDLAGVAIGATVTFNVVVAGTNHEVWDETTILHMHQSKVIGFVFQDNPIGPSMNPARSLGSAIATMNFRGIWIYIIAPVTGAVAGSFAYHFVRLPELKKNTTMAL